MLKEGGGTQRGAKIALESKKLGRKKGGRTDRVNKTLSCLFT